MSTLGAHARIKFGAQRSRLAKFKSLALVFRGARPFTERHVSKIYEFKGIFKPKTCYFIQISGNYMSKFFEIK
jgi:hypothetical protein